MHTWSRTPSASKPGRTSLDVSAEIGDALETFTSRVRLCNDNIVLESLDSSISDWYASDDKEGMCIMAIAVLHESTFVDACLNGAVVGEALHGDRRAAVRLSAEDASWRRAARLKYGPEVRVIDVSTGGILVEVEGARSRRSRTSSSNCQVQTAPSSCQRACCVASLSMPSPERRGDPYRNGLSEMRQGSPRLPSESVGGTYS